jgi:FtsP/CotA-like multicopper oxidase with cupredoxin domain
MSGARIAAVVVVLAIGVGVALLVAGGGDDDKKKAKATAGRTVATELPAPFQPGLPFEEPPVIKTEDGPIELVARNGKIEVSGIEVDKAQSYVPVADAEGGETPGLLGPTLQVEPGETLDITLDNQLEVIPEIKGQSADTCGGADKPDDPTHAHNPDDSPDSGPQYTNLHFHGLHVTPTTRKLPDGAKVFGDNVLLNLPKGKSHFEFAIPGDHEKGTFWYHAHRHGCTDDQVYRGLAGLLIIGDSREDLPKPLRKIQTRSLALKDLQVTPEGDGQEIPADHDWGNPTHRTVNGLVNPTMTIKPRETQLWRLANTSSAVWYQVALVDEDTKKSDTFTVVAQDGNTLSEAQDETSILLGPGQRKDILVVGPADGARVLKTMPFDQGRLSFPEDTLATLEVEGEPAKPFEMPGLLKPVPDYPKARGPDRQFVFSLDPPQFFINGKQFDPDPDSAPLADPELNTTETWTFKNQSGEWHPIHIHQDDYTVTSVNGQAVNNYGQQDVIPLPPMDPKTKKPGTVTIEMPFEDFDGKFVIHCHILDHEDGGMMGRIDLAPDAPD